MQLRDGKTKSKVPAPPQLEDEGRDMKKPDKIIGYDEYGPMFAPRWYESLIFYSLLILVVAAIIVCIIFLS